MPWTRRDVLLAGIAPLVSGVRVEESHHRAIATTTLVHAGDARAYSEEEIARALAARVERLDGLDPGGFAGRFDYGQVSRLPDGRTRREFHLVAEDRELEVAPGIRFPAWTFNGSVPGPTLRCTEGDRVSIHFENRSLTEHTIHLHGIHPANMDGVFELVRPGGSYLYTFDARPYGLQLYHCHVPPVDLHMSRGMYGAFVVDPPEPRPPAKELVLVSSAWDLDFDRRNEIYALNGAANFYRDHPLPVRRGELVRLYFVNVLEHDPINSLHLHANFFKCYRRTPDGEEEEYSDIVSLCQGERRILEVSFPYPGIFMFHAHQNMFAERGGMGHFLVQEEEEA